jgi:hypothetical protein
MVGWSGILWTDGSQILEGTLPRRYPISHGKWEICILFRCPWAGDVSSEELLGWGSYLHGEHVEGGFLSWEGVGAATTPALQGVSQVWEASCRGSHSVLPASFAHRGTEVQWIPLWELMGGMHPEQESGSPVDIGQGLHKCACDVSVSF